MAIDTREKVFETEIEYCLTTFGGYEKGHPSDFDALLGMDAKTVLRFIAETQPKEWESLCKRHGEPFPKKWTVKSSKKRNET